MGGWGGGLYSVSVQNRYPWVSALELSSPVLEDSLSSVIVCCSDLAPSQMTWMSISPEFAGLVWCNARSDWGFGTVFIAGFGILNGKN